MDDSRKVPKQLRKTVDKRSAGIWIFFSSFPLFSAFVLSYANQLLAIASYLYAKQWSNSSNSQQKKEINTITKMSNYGFKRKCWSYFPFFFFFLFVVLATLLLVVKTYSPLSDNQTGWILFFSHISQLTQRYVWNPETYGWLLMFPAWSDLFHQSVFFH